MPFFEISKTGRERRTEGYLIPKEQTMLTHPFCQRLNQCLEHHLKFLKPGLREQTYARNAIVYQPHYQPGDLYYLMEGRVKIGFVSRDGNEVIVRIVEPGEFFGDIPISYGLKDSTIARTMSRSRIRHIPYLELNIVMRDDHELMRTFIAMVGEHTLQAYEHIRMLVLDRVAQRIARWLFIQVHDSPEEWVSIPNMLTHQALAGFIGSSREVVTSCLNTFKKDGLIEYNRASFRVHRPSLERFLLQSGLDLEELSLHL